LRDVEGGDLLTALIADGISDDQIAQVGNKDDGISKLHGNNNHEVESYVIPELAEGFVVLNGRSNVVNDYISGSNSIRQVKIVVGGQ